MGTLRTTATVAVASAVTLLGSMPAAARPAEHTATRLVSASALRVTAAPNVRTIEVGKAFRVVGKAPGRSKVVLQQYVGRGRWLNVGRAATASRSGGYAVAAVLSAAGPTAFRALAIVGKTTATSRNFSVTGLAWFNLYDVRGAQSNGLYERNIVNINGRAYPKSLRTYYGGGSRAWNVNRVCTTFRASIGVDDMNKSDVSGQFQVIKDDLPVIDKTMSFGSSQVVTADITGALRLKLAGIRIVKGDSHLAFGTPQVLCSSNLTVR